MADIFISYSRRDISYARRLHEKLADQGFTTWIDWQDIPPSTDWMQEIYEAIEEADNFIFLLSKNSALSEVCNLEIDHALANNKRIIPILIEEFQNIEIHKDLAAINWIHSTDAELFDKSMLGLHQALQTDFEWIKNHTRIQIKALDWERNERDDSYLLRGSDLAQAETWFSDASDKDVPPTLIQTQYIQLSRREAARRLRRLLSGIAALLVIAIFLGVLAFVNGQKADENARGLSTQIVIANQERDRAEDNYTLARSRELVATSQKFASSSQLDLAMLLGVEAYRLSENNTTVNNLLQLLQAEPFLERFIYPDHLKSDAYPGSLEPLAFLENDRVLLGFSSPLDDLHRWNLETGEYTQVAIGQDVLSNNSRCSVPDPNELILACNDYYSKEIAFFDLPGGNLLFTLTQPNPITSWAVSERGRLIALGDRSGNISVWDNYGQVPVHPGQFFHNRGVEHLAILPGGGLLVSIAEPQATMWDLNTGEEIENNLQEELQKEIFDNYKDIIDFRFHPGGNYLQVLDDSTDNRIRFLWLNYWQDRSISSYFTNSFGTPFHITSYSASYNQQPYPFVLSSNQAVYLVDNSSGIEPLALTMPQEDLFPDSEIQGQVHPVIAVASESRIKLYNDHDHASILSREIDATNWTSDFDISRDGSRIILAEMERVRLWDKGEDDITHDLVMDGGIESIREARFSIDGSLIYVLASRQGEGFVLQEWSTRTMEMLGQHTFDTQTAMLNENLDSLLLINDEGKLTQFNLATHETSASLDLEAYCGSDKRKIARISPGGTWIGIQCDTRNLLLFDYLSMDLRAVIDVSSQLNSHEYGFWMSTYDFAISPSGAHVVLFTWEGFCLYDVAEGTFTRRINLDPQIEGDLDHVIFQGDESRLVFTTDHGELGFYDLEQSALIANLLQNYDEQNNRHDDIFSRLSISEDDKTLYTSYRFGPLAIWDLDPDHWLEAVCSIAGRNLTQEEWLSYFPGESYRISCPQWPAGMLDQPIGR